MALRFRPMPGLTLVTAICVSILISLGTWQYHRLQWKTALLAEVEAAVTAPPLTSLSQLKAALTTGEPVDFRRIGFSASIEAEERPYLVYQSRRDGIYWRAFAPIKQANEHIFGAFGTVLDEDKESYQMSYLPQGQATLAGYVRKSHPMGKIESWVKSKANPSANRYFKFNQTQDWAIAGSIGTQLYLDLDENISDPSLLPVKRPEIRNNHFDYMLTWFSFAIIMLIIYGMMHYRNGRLKWL